MNHLNTSNCAPGAPSADGPVRSSACNHAAHFYCSDEGLLAEVGGRLAETLACGGAAAVLATASHRQGFEEQLRRRGLDPEGAALEGRWLALDAADSLAAILVEGWPDEKSFLSMANRLLDRLTIRTGGPPRILLFGEMVSLLWESGKSAAALHLEELWNVLARSREFDLCCGWPLQFFSRDADEAKIHAICSAHTEIVPARADVLMSEEESRSSAILWQFKAQALEEEVSRSRRSDHVLQLREPEIRDFLENAVIGIHWLGPDGTVLWANRTELQQLGYETEQYVGHSLREFAADRAVVDGLLERIRRGENVRGLELQLRCGNGSLRWFRIDANTWVQDGELLHARCFALDITDEKIAREAQMRLAAIVESSDDAIASKDLNGIVTSWNAAAERILGYKAEEMIGKPITVIIPPELQTDEPEILRKIQAGERIEHFETIRMTKSGEAINVSLTISPVRDQKGRVVGAAKILRDVTAQKKLEAALRTTERLASVGRLAATVAHEINNPLEAVTNLIYIARQDRDLPEAVRACLTAADQELQRVSHIARQTLGFYRDTSNPVWISVPESVDEVLAVYERRFRNKEMRVRKEIEAGLKVCALSGEFKQIVSNLISNAIDASMQGRPLDVRAWRSCHPTTGRPGIRLTVADSGVGIAPEHLRKIFTPFFTTKRDVGTGLGLWIVKDLLEKKGGSIHCRSRVAVPGSAAPSGTVMMIFLPTESNYFERERRRP